MGHNRVYYGLFLVVIVAAIIIMLLARGQKDPYADITGFDSCEKAGYPVVTSDIRMCSLPNGRTFVEQVVQTR